MGEGPETVTELEMEFLRAADREVQEARLALLAAERALQSIARTIFRRHEMDENRFMIDPEGAFVPKEALCLTLPGE